MAEDKLRIYEDDVRVRIYVSEKAKLDGIPLYEAIVLKALEQGLDSGLITRAELERHPQRAELTNLIAGRRK